jgi:hypothetical protein
MDEHEAGVEEARKVLGDLADAAADRGTVTWLTRHRRRIAAIVPVSLADLAIRETQDGGL